MYFDRKNWSLETLAYNLKNIPTYIKCLSLKLRNLFLKLLYVSKASKEAIVMHKLFSFRQAMASELNMYEAQVQEYKYEIERVARELQEVKKKYFMQKKKEQQQK